jgi:hypothetical protein
MKIGLLVTWSSFGDIGCNSPADLIRNQDNWFAQRIVFRIDKDNNLGAKISCALLRDIDVKVAVVGVLHKACRRWVCDIVDHKAAKALQPYKGICPRANLPNSDALRLRPLVVAAAIEGIIVIAGIKDIWVCLSDDLLKLVAAIEVQCELFV